MFFLFTWNMTLFSNLILTNIVILKFAKSLPHAIFNLKH